ncbi:N-acetyl-gamma-glutamyl-phosphate reductase [Moritella marina ATCC 15381]|uniref:N-acetyl-gamma-glutamyl-phosphate reductase n=1 Tax=Moritella marina ATCC 15381 TaxID=1202962 RepID=A0A5J6WGA8_MORMI|nr:N-acetyl-gamma-glutamyl-phosphate reductase [Moritella marina]QFI37023.1 N-acetyl-gamma-glutamyl-phosphate reductase [Moritella marina ATCC 15381]
MKKYHVFIDGQEGTTGLQIKERLKLHPNIELLTIKDNKRKDIKEKKEIMSAADVTVLCLPDHVARESAKLATSVGCRVLDASSAHRTNANWIYGLPELNISQRHSIRAANLVANPGCYATGAILLLHPLRDLIFNSSIAINAISGYSGGGKNLINKYEKRGPAYEAYSLDMDHKHIPEIKMWSSLATTPTMMPAVGNFYQGMLVFIPLNMNLAKTPEEVHHQISNYYDNEPFIAVKEYQSSNEAYSPSLLTPHGLEGKNNVEIYVFGNGKQTLLAAKLDNLGKGASGAAVQNLNIMLDLEESICTDLKGYS